MRKGQTFKRILVSQIFFLTLVGLGMTFLNGCSLNGAIFPEKQIQNQTQSTVQDSITAFDSFSAPSASLSTEAKKFEKPAAKVVPEVPSAFLKSLPVLYYHSIMLESGNEVRMPPDQFEEQMTYLYEHGYHSISSKELELFLAGQGELPLKPFLITFDDGYLDNYQTAFPILQKYNFTGIVFMVTAYINGTGFLSGEQLKKLVATGWNIGGHTVKHAHLTKLDQNTLTEELLNSKEQLEELLGKPVESFAYPFGEYNSKIIASLRNVGYNLAFTTEKGWVTQGTNPFLIPRVYCYANMGMKEFERRLSTPEY